MAAFNSLPVASAGAATTNDAMVLTSGQTLGMDAFDPDVEFDDSLIDYVNGALPPLPFTPSYDIEPFSTFEDPFSYPATARLYEPAPDPDPARDESEPREMDNKLLGFSAPILKAGLVNETGQLADIMMTAELYGMFFVAEDVFEADNAVTGRPLELTCYRRNLWQCSGQLTLPRHVSHLIDEQGRQVPVIELAASITAIESIDGKTTEIISIPWKSSNPSATPAATTEEQAKVAGAPPLVPLDLVQAQEVDASRVMVSVSWKRLQFKHATANNGRRKGLQQHYVVQINLLAKTATGEMIKVAEIQSGAVIVRGRSPRNFDSRRDVPLTGDKKLERRSTSATVSSNNGNNASNSDVHTPPKAEPDTLVQPLQRFHSLGHVPQSTEWGYGTQNQQQQPPHPTKRTATSPSITRPPVPSWTRESTGSLASARTTSNASLKGGRPQPSAASMPLNLSLSEDERSPNKSTSDAQSPQLSKNNMMTGQDFNQSPMETADMLYEYFPLSLDDWSPPIDAIYRPHAAHHLAVLTDIKAQQISNKTKRYFSTDFSA